MFNYANFSVRTKLICGFSALLGLVAVVSWLAILKISDIRSGLDTLIENRYQKVKLSNEVIKDASEIGRLVRSAILADDGTEIESLLQHIAQIRQRNSDILAELAGLRMRPGSAGYELFHQAQRERATLSDKYPQLLSAIRAQNMGEAKAYLNSQWIPANNALMDTLTEYVRYNETAMDKEADAMAQTAGTAMLILIVATAAAVLLGALLSWFIASDLSRRLHQAKIQAELISLGDLRPQTAAQQLSQDEIGQLLAALVRMRIRLAETVSAVVQNALAVSGSAAHLSLAAEQVAESSAHQAHATSSAAASIEELTVSIDSVASNAGDAHQQAIDAGRLASNSGNTVKTAVREVVSVAASVDDSARSIDHLSGEIRQIDAVTAVIRDVAEQTNLLALNAAIEAARAGEMGRGFAVVAAEVRNLAARTSQSVKQISATVGAVQHGAAQAVSDMSLSKEKVAQVVQTSDKTTGAMDDIQHAATAVQASVSLISDALSEQRAASVELAKNLESISQLSEENMASVGAVAGTAKELVGTAAKLEQAISFFNV